MFANSDSEVAVAVATWLGVVAVAMVAFEYRYDQVVAL